MNVEEFYGYVRENGHLLTDAHARRWSVGVLKTLGTVLRGKRKRDLGQALPPELARALGGVFWLLHFPDSRMEREEFQQRVARRSGNSDPDFAYHPTRAVFGGLKRMIDSELSRTIGDELPPDVGAIWQEA